MGYFSRLAVELLEERPDKELEIYTDEDIKEPKTNQELAAIQQEEQYSLWNEQYRQQLEQPTSSDQPTSSEQPKVYKKIRGSK